MLVSKEIRVNACEKHVVPERPADDKPLSPGRILLHHLDAAKIHPSKLVQRDELATMPIAQSERLVVHGLSESDYASRGINCCTGAVLTLMDEFWHSLGSVLDVLWSESTQGLNRVGEYWHARGPKSKWSWRVLAISWSESTQV